MNQISTSIPVEGAKPKSVSSLYVLKALLAFVVVTCHSPLVLSWVNIPGFVVELFFAITGYFSSILLTLGRSNRVSGSL
jgi:hypothetical protein